MHAFPFQNNVNSNKNNFSAYVRRFYKLKTNKKRIYLDYRVFIKFVFHKERGTKKCHKYRNREGNLSWL